MVRVSRIRISKKAIKKRSIFSSLYRWKKNVPFILLHAIYGRLMRAISVLSALLRRLQFNAVVYACRAIRKGKTALQEMLPARQTIVKLLVDVYSMPIPADLSIVLILCFLFRDKFDIYDDIIKQSSISFTIVHAARNRLKF